MTSMGRGLDTTPLPIPLTAPAPVTGRIWHMTDLHFGPESDAADVKNKTVGLDAWNVEENTSLFRHASDRGADLLIVSGDLINSGYIVGEAKKKGKQKKAAVKAEVQRLRQLAFPRAVTFIKKLAAQLGLGAHLSSRVIVCPGNHDVD